MFDPDADYQVMQFKYYQGGPLDYIVGFTLQAGISVNPALSATMTVPWASGNDRITVNSASAFISRGALSIIGPSGENWFTYESHDATTFYDLRRVSVVDTYIPVATEVTQWREVTSNIDAASIQMTTSDVEGFYTFSIDQGSPWSSLRDRQDATILVMESHYDSTYQQWTPFVAMYCGFFGTVEVDGSRHGAVYKVTCHGWWEYLKNIQCIPRTYGLQKIIGERTASSTLMDVGTEPGEGIRPVDFDVNNTGDNNKYTLWISAGAPQQEQLHFRTGTMGTLNNNVQGIGMPRITQIYCSGRDTNNVSARQQLIIEIYNPNSTWQDDNEGINTSYHEVKWTLMIAENSRMQRLYFWMKNGYGIGDAGFQAQTFLYFVYDEKTARMIAVFPDDVPLVEIKAVDGYEPGWGTGMLNPEQSHRNIGGNFYLDPRGDWFAIRGRAGNSSFLRDMALTPTAIVEEDRVAIDQTIRVQAGTAAGFTAKGIMRAGDINCVMTYDGRDGDHFYNVIKHNKDNGLNGQPIQQQYFSEVWHDFVAWGNTAYWGKYPDGSSGISYNGYLAGVATDMGDLSAPGEPINQNLSNYDAYKVWGTRNPDGQFVPGFGTNVAPNGIQPGQSIRRRALIGVYAGPNDWNSNTFTYMDGATAADWHVMDTPIYGNPDSLVSAEWIRCNLGEHKAATVISDDSDVGLNNHTITVGDDEAAEYGPFGSIRCNTLASLSGGGFGGGVEFSYTGTTRNMFTGVQKIGVGIGIDITGATLTQLIDTNPSTDHYAPPRIEAKNYYLVSHVDLIRWLNNPYATVAADNSNFGLRNNTITLQSGYGKFFPVEGCEIVLFSEDIVGIQTTDGGPAPFRFTYTSIVGDTMYGVVKISQANRDFTGMKAMNRNTVPSYWTAVTVRGTRRTDPNDPQTYLGNSTDWEEITKLTQGGSPRPPEERESAGNVRFNFPQSGRNGGLNYFAELVFDFYEMSDKGRIKVNSLNIYRASTERVGDSTDKMLAISGLQTVGTIANIMLAEAGIPRYQRNCYTSGFALDDIQVSIGSVADSIISLCRKGGSIVYETMLGRIFVRDDPSIPGAARQVLDVLIGPNTVWGDVQRKEKSFHEVSQVQLTASNPAREEQYTVVAPDIPRRIGKVEHIDKYYAPDIITAALIAKRIYRKLNGGLVIEVPIGMYYAWKPFDIVRVRLMIDTDEQEINRDFIVKGYKARLDQHGLTGSLSLEEYVSL